MSTHFNTRVKKEGLENHNVVKVNLKRSVSDSKGGICIHVRPHPQKLLLRPCTNPSQEDSCTD